MTKILSCLSAAALVTALSLVTDVPASLGDDYGGGFQIRQQKIIVPLFSYHYVDPGNPAAVRRQQQQEASIVLTKEALDAIADAVVRRLLESGIRPGVVPLQRDSSKLVASLRKTCMSCHSGEKPKGGLAMFHEDGRINKEVVKGRTLWEMWDRASLPRTDPRAMPPQPRDPLSKEDLEALRQWARDSK